MHDVLATTGRSPADFPDSPLGTALAQPTMLGLFLPIQAGGWTQSTLPRTTDWSFDYNKALTLKAEQLGFDLVFALSQWLPKGGYGGVMTGDALDSFTAIAALAGATERIMLISTIHVLYGPWHPLHLAKFGATLDHITRGRWGINVVTGHRAVEHAMFGWNRIEHDRRYQLAGEFVEALENLWTRNENWSFESEAGWKLGEAYVTPKPLFGRPILINATGSDAGIAFAGRHSDIVFVTSPAGGDIDSALAALPAHTARAKQAAIDVGRRVRTLINPVIVCRETDREAYAYADAIVAHPAADIRALDSDAHAWKGRRGHHDPYAGIGGNIRLIGSPERIVDQLMSLHAAGIDGFQLSFYDFRDDLAFFGDRVLPLMRQAGLRH